MKKLKKIEQAVFVGLIRIQVLFVLLYFSLRLDWASWIPIVLMFLCTVSLVWTAFKVSVYKWEVIEEYTKDVIKVAEKTREETIREIEEAEHGTGK